MRIGETLWRWLRSMNDKKDGKEFKEKLD